MRTRIGILVAAGMLCAPMSSAQVVRFQTSLGDFDMVLNPTNNPLLVAHVDNMLQYVEGERYRGSWINRAADGFVLQMGGFFSHTKRPPLTIDSTRPVVAFDPVPGEPAATISDLSNTIGTVSLALPGDGMGGTDEDAGTSSFFINLTNNSFLDADFTVFAAIPDLTVINQIMDLMQVDRTTDPLFGAGPGNLAFTDVPLMDNGFQVFIQRAFVVQDTLEATRARAGVASIMAASAAAFGADPNSVPLAAAIVPEPAAGAILSIGLLTLIAAGRMRRNRRVTG